MRTICGEIKEIRSYGIVYHIINSIYAIIRTGESADLLKIRAHYAISQQVFCCLSLINSFNQYVSESKIYKRRSPDLSSLSTCSVNSLICKCIIKRVICRAKNYILFIKIAVKKTLTMIHCNRLTLVRINRQSAYTCGIYTEVVKVGVFSNLFNFYGSNFPEGHYWLCFCGDKLSSGSFGNNSRIPIGIVIIW